MQAAVRAPAAPWREVLQRALQANQACRHSRYVQLATVRPDGRPANRTIVYRGQLEGDSDTLTFVTDARSRKVEEIAHCPWGEVAWYFPDTREQFRLLGRLTLVDSATADERLQQGRLAAWRAMSDAGRLQFLWPQPGEDRGDDSLFSPAAPTASDPVLDTFCLLCLDVEEVDHIQLAPTFLRHTFVRQPGGSSSGGGWEVRNVNPRIFGEAAGAKEAFAQSAGRPAAQTAAAQRPMAAAAAPAADSKAWPTKPPFIVQPPSGQHKSTVIVLHGLGDSGIGWAFLPKLLAEDLPHTQWVLPNAPVRRISRFGGQASTAWFDIMPAAGAHTQQDAEGMKDTLSYVEHLLEQQAAAGVPPSQVIIGGFSQGGAMALLALRSHHRLAGVLALSAFMPLTAEQPLFADANVQTPTLMTHGDADQVITLERAQRSVAGLTKPNFEFRVYPGLAHAVRDDLLDDIRAFLTTHLSSEA
ncbi:hypothetical protein COHA_007111 [Chlorella ohadii]|uniref:Pyridoxal 5'-phosphate synthase n=1 Tax=Chlorella ohadii TaxID=2649997 RepID=A0AAD5H050_9CHLO|nr:hypothetical protein COHA_007111 [Chlorella ohadii]